MDTCKVLGAMLAFVMVVCLASPTLADPVWADDFEDGVIDPSLWVVGGRHISWTPSDTGSWTWSHDELVAADGHLRSSVEGPYTGNSYGAIAYVETTYDFNDGGSSLVNFRWEADVSESHFNKYYIQLTDGYIPSFGEYAGSVWNPTGTPAWEEPVEGTVNLLWTESGSRGLGYASDSGLLEWSLTIDPAGTAELYDGPDGIGSLLYQGALDPGRSWHVRFAVEDATSAGYGAGGPTDFNLYSVTPEPATLSLLLLGGLVVLKRKR